VYEESSTLTVQKSCNPNSVRRIWSKEEKDTKIVVVVAAICVWFFCLMEMKYHFDLCNLKTINCSANV